MLRVLLADDDPSIQLILKANLVNWGYAVETVADGAAALAVLQGDDPPPIALLDWMMPELDGVEVCRAIRKRVDAPFLYIFLITARTETADVTAGLDAGADDYITKPVNLAEMRSRLGVAARLVAYEARIKRYANDMESLAEERARNLVHADRLATLGTLAAGIAHEISNPVTYIMSNVQLLEKYWGVLEPLVDEALAAGRGDARLLPLVREEMERLPATLRDGTERILALGQSLRGFVRRDSETERAFAVGDCVVMALQLCHNRLKYGIRAETDLPPDLPSVWGRPRQIEQVLVNFVNNAVDELESLAEAEESTLSARGRIEIIGRLRGEGGEWVRIEVRDDGPGLGEIEPTRLFEAFYTRKGEEKGTGLGLFIAKSIAMAHQGTVGAETLPEGGACFWLELPAYRARDATTDNPASASGARGTDSRPMGGAS